LGEIAERLDVLRKFCAGQGITPEDMIEECRHGPDGMAQRASYLRAARESEANLVVQSFLVHNGINVFGDLVCMPATTDALIREQGEQWKPSRS